MTPLRRSPLRSVGKRRRWSCRFCPTLNVGDRKTCRACGVRRKTMRCAGALEAAHIVPRRHRSVRWDPLNGRALCRAHHRYFTDHEKAWRDFIGPEWDSLWVKAQERWDGSFPIEALRIALRKAKEAA